MIAAYWQANGTLDSKILDSDPIRRCSVIPVLALFIRWTRVQAAAGKPSDRQDGLP